MDTEVLEELVDGFSIGDEFELCDVEVETLKRAAADRGIEFDESKRVYSRDELERFGIVREGYNRDELRSRGVVPTVVSSHTVTREQEDALSVGRPFAKGIRKFELPIDMFPMHVAKTIFPPGSVVERHVHPPHTVDAPGGGLRVVVSGKVFYDGREYSSGDWFFVPNGVAYEFTTDPNEETIVFYSYNFFGSERGNRFSHPDRA